MHHELVAECEVCVDCVVPPFDSALLDWAFCLRSGHELSSEDLRLAEEGAKDGDYSKALGLGLFKLESDDACDLFRPRK